MDYTADNSVMSVKDWFLTLLVASLPIIGLIMLFVWAFDSGTNVNKSNLAKAALLLYGILFGFYILFVAYIGAGTGMFNIGS